MLISKYIDPGLIDKLNNSLPSYVRENNERVIMGEQPKFLREAELKKHDNPRQLIDKLSKLSGLMISSSPLQVDKGQEGSRTIELEDQAKTRAKSTKIALDTFLRNGEEAISGLIKSLTKIASRIPKEEPA